MYVISYTLWMKYSRNPEVFQHETAFIVTRIMQPQPHQPDF